MLAEPRRRVEPHAPGPGLPYAAQQAHDERADDLSEVAERAEDAEREAALELVDGVGDLHPERGVAHAGADAVQGPPAISRTGVAWARLSAGQPTGHQQRLGTADRPNRAAAVTAPAAYMTATLARKTSVSATPIWLSAMPQETESATVAKSRLPLRV